MWCIPEPQYLSCACYVVQVQRENSVNSKSKLFQFMVTLDLKLNDMHYSAICKFFYLGTLVHIVLMTYVRPANKLHHWVEVVAIDVTYLWAIPALHKTNSYWSCLSTPLRVPCIPGFPQSCHKTDSLHGNKARVIMIIQTIQHSMKIQLLQY